MSKEKLPLPRSVKPRQFRLDAAVLRDLDYVAGRLSHERQKRQTRSDAVRYAVQEAAKKFRDAD